MGSTGTPSHVVCLAPSPCVLLGSGGEPHTQCWNLGTSDMRREHGPSAERGMASERQRAVRIWREGGYRQGDSCVVLLGHLTWLGGLFEESLGACWAELGWVWVPQEELHGGLLLLQEVLFCGWFSACRSAEVLHPSALSQGGALLRDTQNKGLRMLLCTLQPLSQLCPVVLRVMVNT